MAPEHKKLIKGILKEEKFLSEHSVSPPLLSLSFLPERVVLVGSFIRVKKKCLELPEPENFEMEIIACVDGGPSNHIKRA